MVNINNQSPNGTHTFKALLQLNSGFWTNSSSGNNTVVFDPVSLPAIRLNYMPLMHR